MLTERGDATVMVLLTVMVPVIGLLLIGWSTAFSVTVMGRIIRG